MIKAFLAFHAPLISVSVEFYPADLAAAGIPLSAEHRKQPWPRSRGAIIREDFM